MRSRLLHALELPPWNTYDLGLSAFVRCGKNATVCAAKCHLPYYGQVAFANREDRNRPKAAVPEACVPFEVRCARGSSFRVRLDVQ